MIIHTTSQCSLYSGFSGDLNNFIQSASIMFNFKSTRHTQMFNVIRLLIMNIWFNLPHWYQRRRLKCEMFTDYRRQRTNNDDTSSHDHSTFRSNELIKNWSPWLRTIGSLIYIYLWDQSFGACSVVNSIHTHVEVYSIQFYMIKFVCDLRHIVLFSAGTIISYTE